MGTSAPAIRTHDIPITQPYIPPRQLPAPNPQRLAPDYTAVPTHSPDYVTVPDRRRDNGYSR